MAKTLLRNTSQAPITLPSPYTGIIAPGDSVVLDDAPSVVVETLGIVPWLTSILTVSQVPDAQPVDGHDRAAAAAGIVGALAALEEPLDVNQERVVNAAPPIDDNDLATKGYVDAAVSGGGGGTVMSVTSLSPELTVTDATDFPKLSLAVGTTADTLAAGDDARFMPAPSTAGGVVYDTGTGYDTTAAGTPGQVLKAGAGGVPEWGTDSTTPSGPAGGALSGTYPNPGLADGVVTNDKVAAAAAIATSKLSGLLTDITGNGLDAFVDAATKVARTYYVTTGGTDALGTTGALSDPFATIQAAHDKAADDLTGGEYVLIIVGPGIFTGNVSITRKNTLIQGAGQRAETLATKIAGYVTVQPAGAGSKITDVVGIAGCWIAPPSSASEAAVTATGSTLFGLHVKDCYLYTTNGASTAAALACTTTHPSRPRIVLADCILATEEAGPAIVDLSSGDVRMDTTRINHNSGVTLGSAGNGIKVRNDATLWLNGSLVETRSADAVVLADGATTAPKLLVTNSGLTATYTGPATTTHGVQLSNVGGGLAALLSSVTFQVANTTAGVFAIKLGGAAAVVVYDGLSFTYGTNSAIESNPALILYPSTEVLGTTRIPSLPASLPLKLDANKQLVAAAIALDGAEVTNTLPIGKGGTGIATAPTAGGVVYGGASTQAYTAVGTAGQPLISAGANAPAFGALDLATATNVTGVLPAANQAAQALGGDLSGTTTAATVTKLQGNPVAATALTSSDAGKVQTWSGSAWEAASFTGGGGGGGGGGLTYYMNYAIAADAPTPLPPPPNGTKQLALEFDTVSGQTNTGEIEAPNGTYATLAEFVTDVGVPGITTIPPGNWDVGVYLLTTGSNNTYFRVRVFKWDNELETLTELSTSPSDDVDISVAGVAPTQFTASVYIEQATLTADDRIVVRLEIKRLTSSTRTVTGYFNGNTPAHVHTSIGAPAGTGLYKIVDGIPQSPASLLLDEDVDNDAQIAITKLNGYDVGGVGMVLHASATAGGPPTWRAVDLAVDVTGTLPVAQGGTGLTAGTSGGVPYFSATDAISSSLTLTQHALMLGGGAGGAPATPLGLGTSTQVLHGNASGDPTWGAVALGTDVSGTLPIANGGTNATTIGAAGTVPYSTGSALDYTVAPASTGMILTSFTGGAPVWVEKLGVSQGGTNIATYTKGDLLYASDADTLAKLPIGAAGKALKVSAGGLPEWADDSYSGILPIANGGTGAATASPNVVFAGPGTGEEAAAPSFRALVAADIPSIPATKVTEIPYDFSGQISGTPEALAEVFVFMAVRNAVLEQVPEPGSPHVAYAKTAPVGGDVVFPIKYDGTPAGTLTFANGSQTGVFDIGGDLLSPGGRFTMEAPAAVYGIADVGFTFMAKLVSP